MKFDTTRSEERQNATYVMYRTLHASRHLFHIKTLRSVMTEMMYAEPEAWRAVGITRAALDAFDASGHRPIKGLERAHITDRFKMIANVFDCDEPLTFNELFNYWSETDRVVISLRSENRSNQLGDWIPFENANAKFFQRKGIGFTYRAAVEGLLTRQLWDRLKR